jgi:L-threonylcarbamoyladenylate synthase
MCVADFPMLASMATKIPAPYQRFLQELLPGKFTLLLEAAETIPQTLMKGHRTVGLRIPNLPPLLELINITGTPIITTSVNRSGQPALNNPRDIVREFGDEAIMLLDAGILPPSQGSTILDLTSTPPKMIREGDDMELLKQLRIPLEI